MISDLSENHLLSFSTAFLQLHYENLIKKVAFSGFLNWFGLLGTTPTHIFTEIYLPWLKLQHPSFRDICLWRVDFTWPLMMYCTCNLYLPKKNQCKEYEHFPLNKQNFPNHKNERKKMESNPNDVKHFFFEWREKFNKTHNKFSGWWKFNST
jgi:hypothetical protein